MTKVSILALPNFSLPFVVETDAPRVGLGAILSQQHRLIAFFSQALSTRVLLKSIYDREHMAIVLAIQKKRHYLLGRCFIVHIDQKSLKFLLKQRLVRVEHQKWVRSCWTMILRFNVSPASRTRWQMPCPDFQEQQIYQS